MTLQAAGDSPVHVPAYPVKVRDVSGAGDTVAAVMTVLLAAKTPFEPAMRAANAAAAVVVGKRGTATVSLAELRHRVLPAASLAPEEKIVFDWSVLDERLAEWRRSGLRIGFTNGCFDLLHRGHVRLMAEARAACDVLIVGLNSDASTRRLKGNGRPINPAESSADVLAALEAVDLVVVFEQDTPLELIKRVRPTCSDQRRRLQARGSCRSRRGRSLGRPGGPVDLVPGHSTTNIVRRMAGAGRARRQAGGVLDAGPAMTVRFMEQAIFPPDVEDSLKEEFFDGKRDGFFVDVGANDPKNGSQTWRLEQSGWRGVVVEPQPRLAQRHKEQRTAAVFACACSSPQNAGKTLPFQVSGIHSSLDLNFFVAGMRKQEIIEVPVRTLDDILEEAKAPRPVDFLSIDVESHEIEVLERSNADAMAAATDFD